MASLILETNCRTVKNILDNWRTGRYRKEIKDKVRRHLGNGTFELKADPVSIALALSLKKRWDNREHYYVDVYASFALEDFMLPDKIIEVAKELKEKPTAKKCLEELEEKDIDLYDEVHPFHL